MKKYKKILSNILILSLMLVYVSCAKKDSSINSLDEMYDFDKNVGGRKICVAYFSIDDDIKYIAEKIASICDAEKIEIVPEVAYTKEDLDFSNPNSRVSLESDFYLFDDDVVRIDDDYEISYGAIVATVPVVEKEKITELPKIKKINVAKYDIIFLGFPVWDEDAPKVIYSFLENLKNKIIMPFCAEGDASNIDDYFSNFVDQSMQIMTVKNLDKTTTKEDIEKWITLYSVDFDSGG